MDLLESGDDPDAAEDEEQYVTPHLGVDEQPTEAGVPAAPPRRRGHQAVQRRPAIECEEESPSELDEEVPEQEVQPRRSFRH